MFAESLNFAALKQAADPVRLREQRLRDPHADHAERWATATSVRARARPTACRPQRIDDDDVLELCARSPREAIGAHARAASGPAFLECMTYRWREHVGPGEDFDLGYRARDELQPWMEQRPGRGAWRDMLAPTGATRIEAEVEARDRRRVRVRGGSPFPGASRTLHTRMSSRGQRNQTRCSDLRRRAARGHWRRRWRAIRASSCSASTSTTPRRSRARRAGLRREVRPRARLRHAALRGRHDRRGDRRRLAGLRPIHVHIRMDFLLLA